MTEIMENTVDLEKIKKEVIKDEIIESDEALKEELICVIRQVKETCEELSSISEEIVPLIKESVKTVHNTYYGRIKEILREEKDVYQGIRETLDIRVPALEREIHEIKRMILILSPYIQSREK